VLAGGGSAGQKRECWPEEGALAGGGSVSWSLKCGPEERALTRGGSVRWRRREPRVEEEGA